MVCVHGGCGAKRDVERPGGFNIDMDEECIFFAGGRTEKTSKVAARLESHTNVRV